MTDYSDVSAFHEKFDLPTPVGPQPWDEDRMQFRIKFLEEELKEFKDAVAIRDHAEMFDALIDLVYVALGSAYCLGYPWEAGWDLVQEANMAKVRAAPDGSDSRRGSRFDVVKPEGWEPPAIRKLLSEHGFPMPHWQATVAERCKGCNRNLTLGTTLCTAGNGGLGPWCQEKGSWHDFDCGGEFGDKPHWHRDDVVKVSAR
jgi:predicted HAD superfamily Cof-like phosphohydrolase